MYQNHASIVRIQEHVSIDSPFKFSNVSVGEVKSLLRNINSSKATGYDTIPPKLVKAVANELAQPISSLVNMSLSLSRFPRELKKSETSPLYKGQNNLEPQNYRPLCVFTYLSKIFERVYNDQMGVYLKIYCLHYYLHFDNDTGWQNWWKTSNKHLMKVKMLNLFC